MNGGVKVEYTVKKLDFCLCICNALGTTMDSHEIDFVRAKNEIELSLARTLVTKIEKKIITFDKGQEIARFIVDKLDSLKTPKKLSHFLQELSDQWDIFSTTHAFYKLRLDQDHKLKSASNQLLWQ